MNDPLEGLEEELSRPAPTDGLSTVELPAGVEQDPLFFAYLGLWSLLERRCEEVLGPAGRDRQLLDLHVRLQALEGPLRFAVYEASNLREGLTRTARIQAGESRLKREWLVPKLDAEIVAYRARIVSLRAALEAA